MQKRDLPYEVRIIRNGSDILSELIFCLLDVESSNQRRKDEPYFLVREELPYTNPPAKAKDEIPWIDLPGTLFIQAEESLWLELEGVRINFFVVRH